MNYAIIGCGLIGKKRLAALPNGSRLAVACDTNLVRAEELVKLAGTGKAMADFQQAVTDPSVDAVIVATINNALAPVTAAAIKAKKSVIVEKPGGITVAEVESLLALSREHSVCVRVGFNHRYHPAMRKAWEIFASGIMGELMFIRGRYGHGGRIDYDKEWRADPKISGGGELIDQGVHLIDLAGWFLGEFAKVDGHASTYFWDMPVDDNAFLSLQTAKGQTAWLHVSCTEWKNMFSLEIYGRHTKLQIDGLGGSYGLEKLHHYQMKPEMGPPITTVFEYPEPDSSWKLEMIRFEEDVRNKNTPDAGLKEALAAMKVVDQIYKKSGYPKSS